ncbi:hypothetical protein BN341_6340 [Helicobacter heilmannii ASB1.4]|nr:hypothetical protein BN341_6340 [Helicobacter heilmannii ASB1.4]
MCCGWLRLPGGGGCGDYKGFRAQLGFFEEFKIPPGDGHLGGTHED